MNRLIVTGIWTAAAAIFIFAVVTQLGIDAEALKLYAKWIVGAPALVMAILIAMLLKPGRRHRPRAGRQQSGIAKTAQVKPKRQMPVSKRPESSPSTADTSDQGLILNFFFALFKRQLNADRDAPCEHILAETRPICPNESYEMRVKHQGEWHTRRMSIGLLGQGGGSRSRCYYVIFDTHMVIKIPPETITDFGDYNRQIATEGVIVARLAPRECIVPRVTVIMEAVHTIAGGDRLSVEKLEEHYIHLLKQTPAYLDYLKIGGGFAFFMDLARHFFLSTTLEDLHKGGARLVDEVLLHPELVWDQDGFICRYGEEAAGVCHTLQKVYYHCESRLRELIERAAIIDDVPVFRFKQWFLLHLAGERIPAGDQELPQELIDKANQMVFGVLEKHQPQVAQYRRDVRAYMNEIRFCKQRAQLENLATNMLDLLDWIGSRGLALRDLKPENLFVAGNPDEYPVFLNDTAKFSLGLIDVETAVVIDARDPHDIAQPQLAGTPLYCTPTHLMTNRVLAKVYPDLRKILHFQDWWATIAIIFKIISGENLFLSTARVFPEIISRLKVFDPVGAHFERDLLEINRLFWNSATAEFREITARHHPVLSRIELAVPAAMLPDIVRALHHEGDHIARKIAAAVNEQPFFTSETRRRFLLEAPAAKIRQMKSKLGQEPQGSRNWQQQQRGPALAFFARLETMKEHLQRKMEAAAALKATGAPIAADQLLEAMFQNVFNAMYLPEWPAPTPAKWQGKSKIPKDITTYQATLS